jgi:hypothetical protein
MAKLTGRCLCGAVAFSLDAARLNHPSACHCGQCRRWSGHHWASVNVPADDFAFTKGEDNVTWFASSETAERGFCSRCGASLFWRKRRQEAGGEEISVALGALDAPTGLTLAEHIFVADKGDYYDIAHGLPQKQKY